MQEHKHGPSTWAVEDEEGVIHQGTEEEMSRAYQVMAWDEKSLKHMYQDKRLSELKAKYRVQHKGKLLLSQITNVVQQTEGSQQESKDHRTGDRVDEDGYRQDDGREKKDLGGN